MIRILLVIACLLLLSCGSTRKQMVVLPHSDYSWQIKSDDNAPDVARVSQAIIIFYRQWQLRFGDPHDKIKKNLYQLMIEWSPEEKIFENKGYDIKGHTVRRGVVKGMTLCPTYIWLRTNEYKRVFASSLVHELVHVALWSQTCGRGDPDHEGPKYKCWTRKHTMFIKHLNDLLVKFDI